MSTTLVEQPGWSPDPNNFDQTQILSTQGHPALVVTVSRAPQDRFRLQPIRSITISGDPHRIGSIQGSTWFGPTIARAMALTELNRNWNSHGAQPLDYGCLLSGLDALIAVLHPDSIAPSVFPMANGGINFEWSKAEFSIEVSADRDSGVILSYTDSDREWDGPLEETPSYVEDAFKQLARD